MQYSDEVKEAVAVVEQKLREGVDGYRLDLASIKDRLKELEQKGASGFGGMPRVGNRGERGAELFKADGFKTYFSGKARNAVQGFDPDVLVKNTIMGESGSPQQPDSTIVQADRIPGIVPGAFRSLNLLDFVPVTTTESNKIEYTREASWSNDAAETAEGAEKPESDLTFELVEDSVRTIAHWIKTTKQVFDDSPALQAYLDMRLRHGVRKRLQTQIVSGNGIGSNLSGITDSGRHTAFTPATGDTALDSLNRAKYTVIGSDYLPNFILLNPADWGAIERLKRGTDDGYVGADGMGADYISTGLRGMVWELPVIATNDVASGKFILGDSMAMQLHWRQQATVEISDSDGTDFVKNILTVRAELRAALAVYTPAAIQYGDLTQ